MIQKPVKNLSPEVQLRSNKVTLCRLISAYTVNRCPFCGLFSAMFFVSVCFLLVILLLKMALKCRAEVLSSFPEVQEGCICLTEKIGVR